uniref:Gustatory receptor n=1 Tax=Globodera rostochiensis TaxID=31243 RepID=A0A914HKG1_GLORO
MIQRQFQHQIGKNEQNRSILYQPTAPVDRSGKRRMNYNRRRERKATNKMSILPEQLPSIVFGPFATLASPFLPGEASSSHKRFAKNVLCCASFILLILRSLWYIRQLGTSPNLSLDWAHNSLQLSISLNALSALYWLRTSATEFFREFCAALSKAIGINRMPTIPKSSKICSYILATICVFTCLTWALRQILKMEMVIKVDVNGSYIEQSLSEMQLVARTVFVFSDALAAVYAVLAEWDTFKREQFDDIVKADRILDANILSGLANAMPPMLRFAHLTSNKLENLGMGIFMTAVFCNISASFITSGGGGSNNALTNWHIFNGVDSVNNGAWSIFSIVLLITIIKGPYDVHSKIREIREDLLLSDTIWNSTEQRVITLTKNVVIRIEGTRIHRIGSQLFQLIFVAQVVFVYLLVSGSNCKPHHPSLNNQSMI